MIQTRDRNRDRMKRSRHGQDVAVRVHHARYQRHFYTVDLPGAVARPKPEIWELPPTAMMVSPVTATASF